MVSVSGEDKTSLLLHHNLNDDRQIHIALLASSISIQVGFIISQSHISKVSKRLVHREAIERPIYRSQTLIPGSGKNRPERK